MFAQNNAAGMGLVQRAAELGNVGAMFDIGIGIVYILEGSPFREIKVAHDVPAPALALRRTRPLRLPFILALMKLIMNSVHALHTGICLTNGCGVAGLDEVAARISPLTAHSLICTDRHCLSMHSMIVWRCCSRTASI